MQETIRKRALRVVDSQQLDFEDNDDLTVPN